MKSTCQKQARFHVWSGAYTCILQMNRTAKSDPQLGRKWHIPSGYLLRILNAEMTLGTTLAPENGIRERTLDFLSASERASWDASAERWTPHSIVPHLVHALAFQDSKIWVAHGSGKHEYRAKAVTQYLHFVVLEKMLQFMAETCQQLTNMQTWNPTSFHLIVRPRFASIRL